MSRTPNPDKLNRADYITRTKEVQTYVVSYVPTGKKVVEELTVTVCASDTVGKRLAMKQAKALGKIISCEHTNTEKKLVGMTLEKFYADAVELNFGDSSDLEPESESESEDK